MYTHRISYNTNFQGLILHKFPKKTTCKIIEKFNTMILNDIKIRYKTQNINTKYE